MQGITLAIGLFGAALALFLRPAYALGTLFACVVWYPDYLRVQLGTLDISVGRIVVTVLLLRCLLNDSLRSRFRWSRLDKVVGFSVVVSTVMFCATRDFVPALENRGGFLMDAWFTYMCARLILTDRRAVTTFIKIVAIILAPLALWGMMEAVTHWQPFFQLTKYRTWRPMVSEGDIVGETRKWGLTRAIGPFSHFIQFGACFALFLPLVWALRRERGAWRTLAYPFSGMLILGAFSSMSSGSWAMLLIVLFCMALERYKEWTKTVIWSFVAFCIFAEFWSKRHFYSVLYGRMNFAGGDFYQRVRLIDAAIDNFDEWWLAGYGGRDPGWGSKEGGYFWAAFTDANNEFIKAGIEFGMLGVLALVAIFVVAFQGLVRAHRQTQDNGLRSLYWSLGCCLVGVLVLWQGVSSFGQNTMLFYCMLGCLGSALGFSVPVKPEPAAQPAWTEEYAGSPILQR